jgi:signal transduction histidine kinase
MMVTKLFLTGACINTCRQGINWSKNTYKQVDAGPGKLIYCALIPASMRKASLLICFYLCGIALQVAHAQAKNEVFKDSLLQVAGKPVQDTNTLKAVMQLYRYHFNLGDFSSSLQYCREALQLSKDLALPEKLPRINFSIGLNFTNLVQYDSAKYYLEKAAGLSGTDTILKVQCYNTQAMLASYQSDYSTAVNWLMRSVELQEATTSRDIKVLTAQTYMNLGYNLIAEHQLEKGIAYEKKALTYTGYPDEARYRTLLHLDIADTYIKLNKSLEAALHLDTAISLNKMLNNPVVSTMTANTSGAYYEYIDNLPKALAAFREAYSLCDSTGNEFQKALTAGNIATILFKQQQYKEAEEFAHTSCRIGLATKQHKVVATAYELLKKIMSKQGNYEQALEYADLQKQYADSATNSATQKVTLSLESKYQHQKQEKEIAELTILATEKEIAIIKRNRMLIISIIAAATLLLVVSLLYRNSKQKQTIAEKEQKLQQEHILFLQRQQQVVSLQSMLNGQETERTRIARDLHDGLGGLFSTVKMNFSALQHEHGALKNDQLFQKSYDLVDTASTELRRIAHNMMPEVLMKLGLTQAIQDMCAAISAGKLLQVTMQAYGMHHRLNAATEIMLYRIIQELINNIIKHAHATEAIIQFNKDGNRLTVTVEDNGRGFNMQEVDTAKHTGMETIKSRVHYLNGNINIDSQNGVGTTILMEFLVNENAMA